MQEAIPSHLDDLAQRVRALEAADRAGGGGARRVATGWPEVDAALGGGLVAGAVHEWVGEGAEESEGRVGHRDAQHPLGLLMHLMRQGMGSSGWGVWIGRSCFAYPHGLVAERQRLLDRLLWVDPVDEAGRLWAIDLAARCAGVAAVVADATGLDMAATRRLQLAAEAGEALVLLARPAAERKMLSAATTRWGVRAVVSGTGWPRWEIALLRCKGSQRGAGTEGRETWLLERQPGHGQGFVVVPAERGGRSAPASVQSPAARQRRA